MNIYFMFVLKFLFGSFMYLQLQISVVLTVCNYISPFKNI